MIIEHEHEPESTCIHRANSILPCAGAGVSEIIGDTDFEGLEFFCFGQDLHNPNSPLTLKVKVTDLLGDLKLKGTPVTPPKPSEPISASDTMLLVYTSGTTGLPKAAIIKQSR